MERQEQSYYAPNVAERLFWKNSNNVTKFCGPLHIAYES